MNLKFNACHKSLCTPEVLHVRLKIHFFCGQNFILEVELFKISIERVYRYRHCRWHQNAHFQIDLYSHGNRTKNFRVAIKFRCNCAFVAKSRMEFWEQKKIIFVSRQKIPKPYQLYMANANKLSINSNESVSYWSIIQKYRSSTEFEFL